MTDAAADNRKVLDQIYGAFASGNLEVWKSFFDENSVLIEAETLPYGGRFQGLDRILEAMASIRSCWSDFQYDVEEVYASDHSMIVYGHMRATAAATGRRVEMPLVERWIIENGIVHEVSAVYSDTKLALSALENQ